MRSLFGLISALVLSACVAGAAENEEERFPTSGSYPPGTMERITFTAPVADQWRISALRTPERPDATWKVVIITGTPSWSEYWAPTIAGLPSTRELIVADRPGFAESEPEGPVRDLQLQVEALSPMLEAREGQRVLLIGQSFGAPVATLMAERYPDRVDAVVLVSAYFGDRGPTARRMFGAGASSTVCCRGTSAILSARWSPRPTSCRPSGRRCGASTSRSFSYTATPTPSSPWRRISASLVSMATP